MTTHFVRVRSILESFSGRAGCWEWPKSRTASGYAQIAVMVDGKRQTLYAHRVAYQVATGEDPGDREVAHRCDNPACVNPAHLFLATHAENMRDMLVKGRSAKGVKKPLGARHWAARDPSRVRGSNSGSAKLTDEAVAYIRASAETHAALGRRFGVSATNIAYVRAGKTWRT